jgi:hypothetical protein
MKIKNNKPFAVFKWEMDIDKVDELIKEGWELCHIQRGFKWKNHLLRKVSDEKFFNED